MLAGVRTPVLMQLQAARAGAEHFLEGCRAGRVALAAKRQIYRQALCRLQHAREVPRTRRARRGAGAGRRAGAAAGQGGEARGQRLFDLLRADEMDVAVDAAGRQDLALAGNNLGAGADDDGDAGLHVGVAGLPDGVDAAVEDCDVGLDNAPVVDDQGIGDDGVDGALGLRRLRLAHAVTDHLAAAEFYFFAIGRVVVLDLGEQVGIGEPHAVAGGRAVHVGIGAAGEYGS